jgi:hypothetical protein
MYPQEQVKTNLKDLLIVLGLFGVIGAYLLGALANDDLLWFLPFFNETPAQIVVYRDGCRAVLTPTDAGFAELASALNQVLSQIDGYEPGFGLAPDSRQQYIKQWRALEVTYPKRIKIHVVFRFGSPDTLFIPLNEYFGDARAVFGGIGGDYWASALRLKTIEPLQRAAEQIQCR